MTVLFHFNTNQGRMTKLDIVFVNELAHEMWVLKTLPSNKDSGGLAYMPRSAIAFAARIHKY